MNQLIEQALRYEQEDKLSECEQCYFQALAESPEDKDVLRCVAVFLFKKGDYEKALDLFVQCYSHSEQIEDTRGNVLDHILAAYYQPNLETLKQTYDTNVHALLAYEHNYIKSFVDFDDLPYLCIPRNGLECYIFDKHTKNFIELVVLEQMTTTYPDIVNNDVVLAINIFDSIQLESVAEQTKDPAWINNMKSPVYVIWQNSAKVQQYLQLVNYEEVIASNRVVFFSDYNDKFGIKDFLKDHQAIMPSKIVGDKQFFLQIDEMVRQVQAIKEQDIARKQITINDIAQKYDKKYYKELLSGSYDKIRILFYTSRFSQVVQYGTRDFMRACQELGIKCDMVIEKSDIHQASSTELIHKIAEFKPNIIFRVNFLKSDFAVIPPSMMFITWMQDPGGQINSAKHAQNFCWNDFALTYTHRWTEQMSNVGYDKSRITGQTVPIDEKVFYARSMSQAEREFYTADIAFPGNYQSPEKHLAELIVKYTVNLMDTEKKQRITNLLISTYDVLRSRITSSELIYSAEQCEKLINELAVLLNIKIESTAVKQIAKEFFHPLCYNLHRKITLKWLIDYGFQVKLWGRGWDTDPDFKDNAMGLLTHGDELAKMYSCAKIVPGAFFEYTAHFRCWESTSCGALGMVRYIPEEFDLVNIREYFTENEHFVFYHDKQDLIDKVKYYLVNEGERKRIAENGRRKVLQSMTYSSAVRKCLNLIKETVVN